MEIANKQGKPFYSFVSEILGYALKVYNSGCSLGEIVEFHEFMDVYRALGAKIVSNEAFSYLISKSYPKDGAVLKEKWHEFGRLCGKSLSSRYSSPIDVLEKFLATLEWELNEILVKGEKGNVKIRCISSVLTVESTELLAKFVEGLMLEFGYKVVRQDCLKGIISLEFGKA